MGAWRELCKGVLVEALRFVVAAWGESKHPSSCKQNGEEATWICSDQRDYWEAQARKCRDRLVEAELANLELEAYRSQRFWCEPLFCCGELPAGSFSPSDSFFLAPQGYTQAL